MQKKNALILTGGLLNTISAKTAHGLLRGTDRFTIAGVVDTAFEGKDAGEVMDGKKRNIPVYGTLKAALDAQAHPVQYCIIGVATKGGIIPDSLRTMLKEALEHNLSLVNGLHEYITDIPELAAMAAQKNLEIIDVRKPKKIKDLHFWSGRIQQVKCPIIAVLGTDCALGKRTTTRLLVSAMVEAGFKAEMIYTGQTGWMQGAHYGFIFDSTLNDFISGELEHAVVTCYQEVKPDIIFIEGQSALRNPSGPAGSEWIVSANASAVVLQHDPSRKHYKDFEFYPALIPALKDEIALIKMYGAPTIAIALNTSKTDKSTLSTLKKQYEQELKLPVIFPLEEGTGALVPLFEKMIHDKK